MHIKIYLILTISSQITDNTFEAHTLSFNLVFSVGYLINLQLLFYFGKLSYEWLAV